MPRKSILPPSAQLFLAAFVIIITVAASTLPAIAQESRPVPNLDIILIIDESGSMWLQNDPAIPKAGATLGTVGGGWENPGWRIVLARHFANLLGVEQSGAQHRLGLVVFGSEARLAAPLTDVHNPGERAALIRDLDINHKNMTWTNIPEALRVAQEEMEAHGRSDPNTKRAIVLLTDGKHETHNGMTDTEMSAAHNQVRELAKRTAGNYAIYTVAFTNEAFRADPDNTVYKNLWQEIASTTGGLYFEPTQPDQELLDVYMKILYNLWGLPSEDVPEPVTAPVDVPVEINEDLYEVIISVVKYNSDVQVALIRPDGSVVAPADPGIQFATADLTDSYSVGRPARGTWTVRMSGNGQVIVVPIRVPPRQYKVQRRLPAASIHPLGKPMDIAVSVLDLDQRPLAPESLPLTITLPDGNRVPIALTSNGTLFTGRFDPVVEEGEYLLDFSGEYQGVAVRDQHIIKVIAAPWLKALDPVSGQKYPYNIPVAARVQLMFRDEPVQQPNPGDTMEVVARLLQLNGQSLDTRQLQPAAGGIYAGAMDLPSEATFMLQFQLKGAVASGERFEDITEVLVTGGSRAADTPTATGTNTPVTPTNTPLLPTNTLPPPTNTSVPPTNTVVPSTATPAPTPIPPPPAEPPPPGAVAGAVGGVLALGGLGAVLTMRAMAPKMTGMVDFGGQMYPLDGKRAVVVGSDPRAGIPVQGEGISAKHAELRAIGPRRNPRVEIRSLDATNPVLVQGMPVASQTLENNDRVQIGDQEFIYTGGAESQDFMSADDIGGVNTVDNEWS